MARTVKTSPVVAERFASVDLNGLYDALHDDLSTMEFACELDEFIEEFGYKSGAGFGSHSPLTYPTWKDTPSIVLDIISRYLSLGDEAFEANVHSIPQEALDVIDEAREAIGDDQDKRARFDHELSLAQKMNAEQEDHDFHLDQTIVALLRLPCIEAAARLHEAGVITERDDVFFIKMEELKEALTDPAAFDYKQLVRARKLLHKFREMLDPPATVGGDSESTPAPARQDDREDSAILAGIVASAGAVTGIARVIPNTDVVPDINPGEILVSYNAGPMRTPLFPVIGGLVLDGGNVLLHAAVVAREYKIPAVFMTGNASKVIEDGQTITVDGSAGIVHLR